MATHEGERNRDASGRDALRAADEDRQKVAEFLHAALNEGRLTLAEYDDRVRTAYAARTYADLDALLNDLPPVRSGQVAVPEHEQRPAPKPPVDDKVRRLPLALMILWTVWGGVVAVNVVVWLLVSITTGSTYPWPIWVAGPTGAALVATTVGVQAIRRQRAHDHRK
jgi:hypothetical protein